MTAMKHCFIFAFAFAAAVDAFAAPTADRPEAGAAAKPDKWAHLSYTPEVAAHKEAIDAAIDAFAAAVEEARVYRAFELPSSADSLDRLAKASAALQSACSSARERKYEQPGNVPEHVAWLSVKHYAQTARAMASDLPGGLDKILLAHKSNRIVPTAWRFKLAVSNVSTLEFTKYLDDFTAACDEFDRGIELAKRARNAGEPFYGSELLMGVGYDKILCDGDLRMRAAAANRLSMLDRYLDTVSASEIGRFCEALDALDEPADKLVYSAIGWKNGLVGVKDKMSQFQMQYIEKLANAYLVLSDLVATSLQLKSLLKKDLADHSTDLWKLRHCEGSGWNRWLGGRTDSSRPDYRERVAKAHQELKRRFIARTGLQW